MEYINNYNKLLELLTEEVDIDGKKYLLKEEFEKFFEKNNKTAATRIRKIMQLVKGQAQEIRDEVQNHRKND